MASRVLIAIVVMMIGLFSVAIPASAAPSYGAPGVTATLSDEGGSPISAGSTVNVGDSVVFSGDGFEPFEDITVVVSTLGADGLTVVDLPYKPQADGNGHFELKVPLTHLGVATLTATGTSGKTVSLTVQVGPDQSHGGTTATTTVAAGAGSPSGGGGGSASGGGAGSPSAGGAGSSSAGGTGLAYTGASILGPLAIGASALFAGLAMLFFGTRGAIRRKRRTPSPSG